MNDTTSTREQEIRDEMLALQDQYHAGAAPDDDPAWAALHERLHQLRAELAILFRGDCLPCPACQTLPHAMRKNPWQWEIGCLVCLPVTLQHEDGRTTRVEPRVRVGEVNGPVGDLAVCRRLWDDGARMEWELPALIAPSADASVEVDPA